MRNDRSRPPVIKETGLGYMGELSLHWVVLVGVSMAASYFRSSSWMGINGSSSELGQTQTEEL